MKLDLNNLLRAESPSNDNNKWGFRSDPEPVFEQYFNEFMQFQIELHIKNHLIMEVIDDKI